MRPLILGMNNPISSAPEHALFPAPEGCTWHRLWVMLHDRTQASRGAYLQAFERRNLVLGRRWSPVMAREAAGPLIEELRGSGRTVVVLGAEVRDALRLPRLLIKPQELHGVVWRQLPHPSGRNLWFNNPENRELACLLLEELYRASCQPDPGPDQREMKL